MEGNVWGKRSIRRGKSEERKEATKWLAALLLERNLSPSTCFIGLPESKTDLVENIIKI